MKLTIALLSVVLLSACASGPDKVVEVNKPVRPVAPASAPVVEAVPAIDEQCAALAKNARAIATFRDSGVPKSDVQFLIEPPKDYPLDPMAREVYARTDISPPIGATNSYGVCVKVGYANMTAALKDAQVKFDAAEAQRVKDELAAKKKARPAVKPAARPATPAKPAKPS
jgi:hypothetical protein